MNFKTIIRLAKLPWCKVEFSTGELRVVNADNHVMVWSPSEQDAARNVDGEQAEEPTTTIKDQARIVAHALSVPLESMVKVNGDYLRRAISALETRGKTPVYLDIQSKRIIIAYEVDGVIHRAAVACMKNE